MTTFIWLALLLLGLVWLSLTLSLRQATKRFYHLKTGQPVFAYCSWTAPLTFLKRRYGTPKSEREEIMESLPWLPDIYAKWYGPVCKIVVCSPKAISEVVSHKSCDKPFEKIPPGVHTKRVLGDSLALAPDRGNGRRFRRIMNPAFKHAKLNSLVPVFVSTTKEMLEIWNAEPSTTLDVSTHFKNITFDIIGKTAFGYDFRCLYQRTEERSNLELFFAGIMQRSASKDYQEKLNIASQKSEELVGNILRERKASDRDLPELDKDLLDHILASDGSSELTESEIMQNIYLFFLAGQETSAGTLVSAMYFLSTRPEIQEKAFEEIHQVLGNNDPSPENIVYLPYLDAVLKETLRLNVPVVSIAHREATEDLVLDNYFIPKGTALVVNLIPSHSRPEIWGANVKEYSPDRWLGEAGKQCKLLTFSEGPRICIGKKFSWLEMKVILSMIIQRYTWTLVPGYKWTDKVGCISTTPKDNLKIILERRK